MQVLMFVIMKTVIVIRRIIKKSKHKQVALVRDRPLSLLWTMLAALDQRLACFHVLIPPVTTVDIMNQAHLILCRIQTFMQLCMAKRYCQNFTISIIYQITLPPAPIHMSVYTQKIYIYI